MTKNFWGVKNPFTNYDTNEMQFELCLIIIGHFHQIKVKNELDI